MSRKHLLFLYLSVLLAWNTPAWASVTWISFSNDGVIFVSQLDGQEKTMLAKGYDPDISPDGKLVAFTAYAGDGDRTISLADRETGEIRPLTSIPGKNSYGPRWSPDGSSLLINHWDEAHSDWTLATVHVKTGDFRVLVQDKGGLYSPFWSHDGKFVFAHDLECLFKIDVAGDKIDEGTPLSKFVGEGFPSSAIYFSPSPDGERWLFDCDVEGGERWSGLGEPGISAVFLLTLKDGSIVRLTDQNICAVQPSWLPTGNEFIFSGYTPDDISKTGSPFSIYRQDISGGESKLILKEGGQPSTSK